MTEKIKDIFSSKLIKHSFVFVFVDIINKSIPFLLLPILTHYLSPADYGIIASFNSLISILAVFIGLSVHGAVNVNFYKLSKEDLGSFIGNVVLILIASTIIVSIIVYLFRFPLEDYLKFPWQWFFAAVVMSLGSFLVTINLTLWIAEQEPKKFGAFNILDTILKLGMSLWFVVIMLMDWRGRVIAMVIGTIIMSILSLIILWRRGYLKFNYSPEHIKDALNFGIPLVPHQLGSWLKNGAVILILVSIIGTSSTGLYDIGFKIASILSFVFMAFNKAYQPFLFRKLKENPTFDIKASIVKQAYFFMAAMMLGAVVMTLFAPYLISVFLDPKFADSYIYVGYLAFAFVFQGMYLIVVSYIFYEKKTKYLAYITFVVSVVHIILAYALIQNYGALGAAQASLVSFAISFLLVWYYSNKVYPMPWFSFRAR